MKSCASTLAAGARILLEHLLHDALEQRDVAVDPHRQEQARRSALPRPSRSQRLLRILEPDHPRLRQRIDADDLAAVARRLLQLGEHARMTGAGILADDEDRIGRREVLDLHRRLADADRPRSARCRSTRGTCSSSRADCWCRTAARTARTGTRPRCSPGPRCRTPPRPARRARGAVSPISANASLPRDRLVVIGPPPPDHRDA